MSKFKTLVLCLSISDITLVLEVLSFIITSYTDNGKDTVEYSCAALKHVMAGTFIFSLYQCFVICLERLNATFATNKGYLHVITSLRGVCTCFVLIQVVMALHLVNDITRGHKPCTTPSISVPSFVLVVDLPVLLLCIAIVGVYIVIIFRIVRQQSINQTLGLGNARSADVMKKSAITLGIIIAVSLVGIMPRPLLAVVSMFTGKTFTSFWMTLSNVLLLLNPLVDPIIYVFCVKEFGDKLKLIWSKTKNSIKPMSTVEIIQYSLNSTERCEHGAIAPL
ncbi:TAAR [Mytilus coruscus]|uniref:TAAR n=1 Tax=Mytilus coruscus TaxID=42192 RepID=A0A6J8BRH0_MYTCO|nr:TAAR [Mytilus coruscus]